MFVCLDFTISTDLSLIISLFSTYANHLYFVLSACYTTRKACSSSDDQSGRVRTWMGDRQKIPLAVRYLFCLPSPFLFLFFYYFFLSLLFLRTKPLVDIFIITIFIFFKFYYKKYRFRRFRRFRRLVSPHVSRKIKLANDV